MKLHNVIFAGTARNVEAYIKTVLEHIDACGQQFKSFKVLIYENDSSDETRSILLSNKKCNYEYIFEDNIVEPRRTMRISNGRNLILKKIQEINVDKEYTYLIMLDLDDVNASGTFVKSIRSCFEYDNWSALTGNQSDRYYDVWALRQRNVLEHDFNREYHLRGIISRIRINTSQPNTLIEVDSAFSGIAIYELSAVQNCIYVGAYEDGMEACEHVEFNRCLKKNGGSIYINTAFLTNSDVKSM